MQIGDWLTVALAALSLLVSVGGVVYAARSGRAAERSAASSELAAEASVRSAKAAEVSAEVGAGQLALAEAGLSVSLEAEVDRHGDGAVWFTLEAKGVNVFIHGVTAYLVVITDDFEPLGEVETELRVGSQNMVPHFLHSGESVSLIWDSPSLRPRDRGIFGRLSVRYSVSEKGAVRARKLWVEEPENIGKTLVMGTLRVGYDAAKAYIVSQYSKEGEVVQAGDSQTEPNA
ncbi:hypothetical protein [Micromonospora sp. bgisy143]|uniref:hypothetical protein n=1 Tax=Micromonospora sp. bgisy143 TaxID=3413790 RepID=UPI003EBC810F